MKYIKLSKKIISELSKIDDQIKDKINGFEKLTDKTLKIRNGWDDLTIVRLMDLLVMISMKECICSIVHSILLITLAPSIKKYHAEIIQYVQSLMMLNKELVEKIIILSNDTTILTKQCISHEEC